MSNNFEVNMSKQREPRRVSERDCWDEEYQKPQWVADWYRRLGVRPPWGDKTMQPQDPVPGLL